MNKFAYFNLSLMFAGVIGLGAIATCTAIVTYSIVEGERIRKSLFQEVSTRIDINEDGISIDEWIPVYEKMGINFDQTTSNPKLDLNVNLLEKYIALDDSTKSLTPSK